MKNGQFPAVLQLSALNGKNGFKLYGEANSGSGYSISMAGDINGDGHADLLIGAPYYNSNTGRSYVVFGGAGVGSEGVFSLSNLNGTNGFKLDGESTNSYSGQSVSAVGDINSDGHVDLLIGAPNYNGSAGRSYVVFGGYGIGSGGVLSLSNLNGTNGFKLDGESANSHSGQSVSAAGDINGDSHADLLIGAYIYNLAAGRSYVVFGGFGVGSKGLLSLSTLNGTNGFKLDGESAYSYSGQSVSTVGDINGDGYADLLIGAYGYNYSSGRSYVVFGGSTVGGSGSILSLLNLNGVNGFKLDGEGDSGYSVSAAGDVNGDGCADLLIGAYNYNGQIGCSYVVFGDVPPVLVNNSLSIGAGATIAVTPSNLGAYDRNHNNQSLVFVLTGLQHGFFALRSAPTTPVVNVTQAQVRNGTVTFSHDGSAFAPSYNVTVRSTGIAWTGPWPANVTFITPTKTPVSQGQFPAILPLASLNGQNGFKLDGENKSDRSGYSVSAASDINGDGYADLLIGAYGYSSAKGRSYVMFGGSGVGKSGVLLLSRLNGTNGFKLDGENNNDWSGYSISAAGDINGDGYNDLLIGAGGYPGPSWKGRSYVVFGGPGVGKSGGLLLSSLNGTNGFKLDGENNGDWSGHSVSAADDINGDGHADLLIGAYSYLSGSSPKGRSYVVFGGPSVGKSGGLLLSSLNGTNGFKLDGENNNDYSGCSVSAAGDINGDGHDDLLIGAYGYPNMGNSGKGRSYVVFGGPGVGKNGDLLLSSLNGTNGFKLDGENNKDESGSSVSAAGDINGDGYNDLLIGAYGSGGTGRSYVVFGGPGVGQSGGLLLSSLNGTNGFKLDGENNNDFSGWSVSTAGDINGDGYNDLLIGAFQYTNSSNKGRSYVVFGGPGVGKSGDLLLSSLNGTNGFKLDGENNKDESGSSVSAAGDINGDSVDDILIGAYGYPSGSNKGRSYVVFGDVPPVLANNSLSIGIGSTVILTPSHLGAYDRNHNNQSLVFVPTALQHGNFTILSTPATRLMNFTQAQVRNGTIQFMHDGSSMAPSYNITVRSSGIAWTGPSAANITFIPAAITTPVFSTTVSPSFSSSTTHTASPTSTVTPTTTSMPSTIVTPTSTTTLTPSPTPTSTLSISSTPTATLSPSTTMSTPILTSSTTTQLSTTMTPVPTTTTPSSSLTPTFTPAPTVTFTPSPTISGPILINNQLTLNNGQTVILSPNNLQAVEAGMNTSSLIFYISNVENGYFSLLPINASVTRFIQSYVQKGQVQFVHSGDHQAPSYSIVVSNGAHATAPSPALIDFVGAPTITTTPVTLMPGGSTTLTTSNLNVSNTGGNSPNQIVFQVSNQQHVQFNLNTSSTPVSNFTLTQLIDHNVQLVQDNSNIAPSYSITATGSNGLSSASTPVNVQLCNSLTNPSSCTPTIVHNNLWIKQGTPATLTTQNLYATDSSGQPLPSNTVFYVTNVNHGYFDVNGSSSSFFTQQQLQSGVVQFIGDGASIAPSYEITVQSSNLQTNSLSQVTLLLDNKPPYLAGTLSNQIAVVGQPFSLSLGSSVFADPQGDPLILSAGVYNGTQLLPGWLSFNPGINRFSGTPTESGVLDIGVTATDPEGLSTMGEFSLTVNDVGNEASNFNIGLIAGIGAGAASLFLFGCCLYKYLRKPNAQAPTAQSREGKTSVSKSSRDIELLPLQSPRKVTASEEIKTSSQSLSSASIGSALTGLQAPGNLESLSVSKSSDRPASPSLPGLVKDDYKMEISLSLAYRDLEFDKKDELGSGAYGTVYKGTYKYNDVAIKELHTKHLSQAAVEELKQEAGILGSMRSDYIVQLRGICLETPHYCLVMELMPKGSLYGLLQNSSELPLSVRYRIGLDVCCGLYQLHELNILHRDLKSLNVLLDDRLRAKISDFGLSKVKSEMSGASSTKDMKGTLGWMAPELFAEKPKATTAADIYALGMVLWEMMIKPYHIPFKDMAFTSVMAAKVKRGEQQETISDSCPPEMADLIKSCWQEPDKRPSAEALAKSLSTLFKSSPARPSVMQDEKAKTEVIQQDDLLTVVALNN